ncbi:CHAT domain-containing protein [Streptomyces collinus]|uniref:CHAT domain-containing protein n=1 Tax=Streptomyces collinus TaxID=42684 RepID=UPI0036B94400
MSSVVPYWRSTFDRKITRRSPPTVHELVSSVDAYPTGRAPCWKNYDFSIKPASSDQTWRMVSKGLLKVTVRQRIEGFLVGGDSQDLLTQKAARDAGRLKRSATGFRQGRVEVLDAEGVHLVAMLYWCRGCMPSNPMAEAEIAAAEKLFRLLSPGAADPVPRAVRELRRHLRREAAETALGMLATAEAQADAGLADQALEVLRGALESAPTGDADITDLLHRLSLAHRVRFCILGHADDIARAIELARAAAQHGGAEHHKRLANLAGLLQHRYLLLSEPGDLDESVALSREGLAAEGDAGLTVHGAALCGALLLRHQNSGAEQDLDEAIELGRTVLAHCTPDAPKRAEVESFFARSLLARHWRTRCPDDLEEALSLSRAAVRDAPTGSTFRTLMMGNLAGVLRDRFGVTGVRADLDEAIGIMETVLRDMPEEHADFAAQLGNFGVYHRVRYEHGGDPVDLDTALEAGRAAVRMVTDGNASALLLRSNLCLVLAHRHDRFGERTDLDEATTFAAGVVAAMAPHDPERGRYLHLLGRLLRDQFALSGDPDDLEEAISQGRRAVESVPATHSARGLYLTSLSGAYRSRYDWTQDPQDLHEAAELALTAVRDTPEGHPDRPGFCSSAAIILGVRGSTSGPPGDLDRAVALVRSAVAASPPGHPALPHYLGVLGDALLDRYESTGDSADLEEATRTARRSVAETSDDVTSARARALFLLGCALAIRHRSGDGDAQTAQEAFEVLDSVRTAAAGPALAVDAALASGRLAISLGQWERAARYYDDAVSGMPAEIGRDLSRRVQERRLVQWSNIPAGAAALAVRAADPERAVELLEIGRGFLLGRGMELRAAFDAVQGLAPDLAARLESAATALQAEDDEPVPGGGGYPRRGNRRQRAAADWEAALAEARGLPGLGELLSAPRTERLRAAAAAGSVVVVNVSMHRCDALIVRPDTVLIVPLAMTAQEAGERATDLVRSILLGVDGLDVLVGETLRWLWRTVARPVLAELGLLDPSGTRTNTPRVWWCPTGPLTVFPLHAAEEPAEGGVLDRVISSYTPTLRALLRAAESAPGSAAAPEVLVAARPGNDLPGAEGEVDVVRERFPDAAVLVGSRATRRATLDALSRAEVVHFACHGVFDPLAPSTSGLRLSDGTMTVLDVSRLHLRGAELAYLSACSTAVSGVGLMDESIHLTSALQLAGFRQVIGTLWPVHDLIACQVAEDVYARLAPASGGTHRIDGAAALHHAVGALRASHPNRPFLWASYVHIGP